MTTHINLSFTEQEMIKFLEDLGYTIKSTEVTFYTGPYDSVEETSIEFDVVFPDDSRESLSSVFTRELKFKLLNK